MIFTVTETCLAVAASICVGQAADITIRETATFSGVVIEVDSAKITSEVASDNLVSPDVAMLTEWCQQGVCVHYHRHCSVAHARSICTISYVFTGMETYRRLMIETTIEDNSRPVLAKLYLMNGKTAFPLAGFSILNEHFHAPYLRNRP